VIALERDSHLADVLRADERFSSIEIIEGNALETLPILISRLKKKKISYVLAGNIPYYITGHLLRVVGDSDYKPLKTVLLIQKEVALRLCAQPPKMNLLAATIQIWATPRILFSVPRGSFSPPPDVDSAVVELQTIPLPFPADCMPAYFSFIRALFKQPRKTLVANARAMGLATACIKKMLPDASDASIRGHQLSNERIEQLFAIYRAVCQREHRK
jgi:16S rRNA (adenine1518-N6/adenine1519-N6)-dimethyltransferase